MDIQLGKRNYNSGLSEQFVQEESDRAINHAPFDFSVRGNPKVDLEDQRAVA